MGNDLSECRYRFSEVALAAGAPPARVRTWFDRAKAGKYAVDLDADLSGGGWAKFSALDAVRISLVRNFAECCVPVTTAFEMAGEYISRRLGLLSLYGNTPARAVCAGVAEDQIWFWPGDGDWRFAIYTGTDSPLFESGGAPGEVFGILRAGLVVQSVFDRLELGNEV